ncbi:MAG: DUF2975 domain-containing protein [Robiginitomaculum sp.]
MNKAANDPYPFADDELADAPRDFGRAASALSVVLRIAFWLTSAALVIALMLFVLCVLNGAGVHMWLPKENSAETYQVLAMVSAFSVAGILVIMAVISQLRKIVKTLGEGDPFVPQNARRLRNIWVIMAGAELARTIAAPLLAMANRGHEAEGMGLPFSSGVMGADGVFDFDIRLHVWFFVLILIVLAQVFREGARLRADAQLTV